MQISQMDQEKVLEALRQGQIDAADISFPNLIDEMVLKMKQMGLLQDLAECIPDKRASNKNIPLEIILTLAVAAKMKIRTSLTDIPFAITDAATLSELGWNIWDNERGLAEGLMTEGMLRNLISKYSAQELIGYYNDYIRKYVFPRLDHEPNIHILDCTVVTVPLANANYENATVAKDDKGKVTRGYKLATLRGIYNDTGILEEISLGTRKTHDLELSRDMVLNSQMLKVGDLLINDRGFLSRIFLNMLKTERGVDVFMPIKKNMEAYEQAVSLAKSADEWQKHPNKNRKSQKIAFVENLGQHWQSDTPEQDVDFNACVVYDEKKDEYHVFITTDLSMSACHIIKTYELRPEIEEDYRQIKDFWRLEDFTSTKYNFVAFHIVSVLLGYMYFQIFKNTESGSQYNKRSLPVALKKYVPEGIKSVIIYSGQYFAIFGFFEFIQFYADCDSNVKKKLEPILRKV